MRLVEKKWNGRYFVKGHQKSITDKIQFEQRAQEVKHLNRQTSREKSQTEKINAEVKVCLARSRNSDRVLQPV